MKLPALGMAIAFLVGPAVAVADDLEDAVQSLKDAAAKKDAPLVPGPSFLMSDGHRARGNPVNMQMMNFEF